MNDNRCKKNNKTDALLKSSFWYIVSNFFTRAMVFITTPLFARLIPKDKFGDFNVYASWQAILITLCGLELYGTINKARFDYKEEQDFSNYITTCLWISSGVTGILFVIYLLFPEVFQGVLSLNNKYILAMFAYLFTYPALAMFQAKQRIEYHYKLSAGLSFGLVLGSSFFAIGLTLNMSANDRIWGRVLGQYLLYIIVGLFLYVLFIRKGHRISINYVKYALRLGIPLAFSSFGSQILMGADALVVKHLSSGESVSNISVTHTCGHIIVVFVQTLNYAWAPWFYDKLHENNILTIKKVFRIYVWFVIFCTFGVLFIGPELMTVIGGKNYKDAVFLLPPVFLSGIFTVLITQFVNLETYHKKNKYAAILTLIVGVVNLVLDIVGVVYFGYYAACYATVVCQLILVLLHYYFTVDMGIRDIYSPFDLLISILTSLLLIPITIMIYRWSTYRLEIFFFVIIVFLIFMFVNKDKLKSNLRSIFPMK